MTSAGMPDRGGNNKIISTGLIGVTKDEEFGNVYFGISLDAFHKLGFAYGDSVDVLFDNGKEIADIPYYSGYYTPIGELMLCGYPGSAHVKLARNNGEPTWEEFCTSGSPGVTVSLHQKGKYRDIEDLHALIYSDDRKDYDSDSEFCNFRELHGGRLKRKTFYRAASVCDNKHGRTPYVNRLAEEAGVKFVLNLAENEERYIKCTRAPGYTSSYCDLLYENGDVLLLALNANYRSAEYAKTVAEAMMALTKHNGPFLFHCLEGKDRTGFVCALLLALAGASAQEIIDDYMLTYDNYYGITMESNPARYRAIQENVNGFLYFMCGAGKGTPFENMDLKKGAEEYLRRGGLDRMSIKTVESSVTQE